MLEILHEKLKILVSNLICPACSDYSENKLLLKENDMIQCSNANCLQRYRVIDGIPRLLTKSGDFMNEKDLEEFAPTYRNS